MLAEALSGVAAGAGQPPAGGLQQLLRAGHLLDPVRVPLLRSAPGGGLRGAVARPPVAVPAHGALVPVDFQDRGGDALQEAAVVGDRDDGAAVRAQVFLQPAHGGRVEVVRRFVQQQQFGGGGQDAGEREARLLAAGQRAERALPGDPGQPEPVHGGLHPGVRLVAAALLVGDQQLAVRGEFLAGRVGEGLLRRTEHPLHVAEFGQGEVHGVLHGAVGVEAEGLGEVAGPAGEADGDLPGVRRLGPGEQPQQGGLAGSVLADDGGLLARPDGEGDLVEDGPGAVRPGDGPDGQLRHGGDGGGQGGMGALAHGAFPGHTKGLRAAETAARAVPGLRRRRGKPCPQGNSPPGQASGRRPGRIALRACREATP